MTKRSKGGAIVPAGRVGESDSPTRVRDNTARAFKFNGKRRTKFLRLLEDTGMVLSSCRGAGISSETAYDHRKRDAVFAQAWSDALELYADRLEQEAYRRAVMGVDEPVFQQGEQVGVVRRYSDSLLAIKLKAHRPDRYRERVSVDANVAVSGGVLVVGAAPSDVDRWVLEQGTRPKP